MGFFKSTQYGWKLEKNLQWPVVRMVNYNTTKPNVYIQKNIDSWMSVRKWIIVYITKAQVVLLRIQRNKYTHYTVVKPLFSQLTFLLVEKQWGHHTVKFNFNFKIWGPVTSTLSPCWDVSPEVSFANLI